MNYLYVENTKAWHASLFWHKTVDDTRQPNRCRYLVVLVGAC